MFEEVYVQRVRHVYSRCQSTDEELALLDQIGDTADSILVQPLLSDGAPDGEPTLEVTVNTTYVIAHFYHFRNHYEGHASRALITLLRHFAIHVPLTFVLTHPFILIDLQTCLMFTEEGEFALAERPSGLQIVERVDWAISADRLYQLRQWAQKCDLSVELLVELALSLLDTTENALG